MAAAFYILTMVRAALSVCRTFSWLMCAPKPVLEAFNGVYQLLGVGPRLMLQEIALQHFQVWGP